MANVGYIKNRAGILKILTIIVGAISVVLIAFSCDSEWKEEVFLGIAIAFLVISLIYLIFHLAITDAENKTANKGLDSGYHFLGALLLLCGGILMVYSAVDLENDIWYFCTYGIGGGIPCIFNKRRGFNIGAINIKPPSLGIPTYNSYYGTEHTTGGGGYGRSFLGPKLFSWLGGGQEICTEVLPRVLDCNRYFELKLVGGILGIINAILYGVVGIVVLLSSN